MIEHMELPLVLFTILSQAAIGLALVTGFNAAPGQEAGEKGRRPWRAAAILLVAGLAVSLFHLGHPLSAPMALKHVGVSWLSREVLLAALLAVLLIYAAVKGAHSPLGKLCAVCGLAVLFAQAMTYTPAGYPALAGWLPVLFFLVTAVSLERAWRAGSRLWKNKGPWRVCWPHPCWPDWPFSSRRPWPGFREARSNA